MKKERLTMGYIEKFNITEEERTKVIETYFKDGLKGKLSGLPSKEKRKIIIIQHLVNLFEKEKQYSELEINSILKEIYDDYAVIRRYLIDFNLLERSKDGSVYWVK
jgi:hypothetical protein